MYPFMYELLPREMRQALIDATGSYDVYKWPRWTLAQRPLLDQACAVQEMVRQVSVSQLVAGGIISAHSDVHG